MTFVQGVAIAQSLQGFLTWGLNVLNLISSCNINFVFFQIIMSNKKLCLLSIKAKNENGIRVITIDYTFQVLNKTKEDIEISVMSLFDFPEKKMDKFSCSVTIPVDEGMDKPVPLPYFEIVGQMTGDQILFDGFQTFTFKIGDSEWSQPLNLGECRNATKGMFLILCTDLLIIIPLDR